MSQSPTQHLLTLQTLDRLVSSVAAKSSANASQHLSPLAMRALPSPWLSSKKIDFKQSPSRPSSPPLTQEEQEELVRPRHMSESYTEFELPLASDKQLLERYVNASSGVRIGLILEHLDSLAGAVAYRHCLPTPLDTSNAASPAEAFKEASARAGLYLATASADRLDMFEALDHEHIRDLRFSGFVSWTGNSSMEVSVKMQGSVAGKKELATILLGNFTMVCRDIHTSKAKKVPSVIVETEEERSLWAIGEENRRLQKENSMKALDKVPPSAEESKQLHELMLRVSEDVQELNGQKVVQMRDTKTTTVNIMFPQSRNLHGKVFGGLLMCRAHELAFTTASLFASRPMRFISLDRITFKLPVPIGAVLRLTSKVVYTTEPREGPDGDAKAHIMVRAEVEEVETGLRRETNTFFFTLGMDNGQAIGKTVVPSTYKESMDYLEGKRRVEVGDEMRKLYNGVGIQQ